MMATAVAGAKCNRQLSSFECTSFFELHTAKYCLSEALALYQAQEQAVQLLYQCSAGITLPAESEQTEGIPA
jgi:hypothetical protein